MKARVPERGPFFFKQFRHENINTGRTGSFHEVAARQYFSYDDIEIVPCPTFDLTLNTVKQGKLILR